MNTFKKTILLLALFSGITISCKDEPLPPIEPDKNQAPELTQKVNLFIEDVMKDIYLWYDKLPEIDTKYEFDSKAYFDKLLYIDDKWSFVTDDVVALENSFAGIETSYGWSLAFGRFSNTDNVFAIIEFVYPNTPAAEAGLKRGDIIVEMSGSDITDENYKDLLSGENLTVSLGVLGDGSISVGSSVSMTARELHLDPVVLTKVIDYGGHKIGYLFYAQYIKDYNISLDTAFQYLMDKQIDDLVLDLRYNPGGETVAAQHLCSSIVPLDAVNNKRTLVSFQWNDKYQKHWEDTNVTQQLKIQFDNYVAHKMDLPSLHVLTGTGTASASELTITGLKPYMQLTTVGETTYGKYTASITFKPEDIYDSEAYYDEFKNWGIQPIVLRYANSQGVTDFKDGFLPDIAVNDELFGALPLGNKEEPLLKAAIEDITGVEVIAMKSAVKIPDYTLFDRGFSKFDANKREVLLDHSNIKLLK
ncbi:MAG: S41 family peptidase [Draconibacterium sp.]|nr:S41 family peptidase [Draconibacterium sp.]